MLISSGKDVNILGSNITGKDGNIVAGYYQDDNGNITRNEGNVNVMSVTELAKNYEYSFNEHFDYGGFLVATASGAVAGTITGCLAGPAGCGAGAVAGTAAGAGVGLKSKSGHENTDESILITQVSSNLTFNNLDITASKDVNVQSSNINIVQNLVINAESFNIKDAYDTDKKTSIHTNISPDYVALAVGGAVAGAASAYISTLDCVNIIVQGYDVTSYVTAVGGPTAGLKIADETIKYIIKSDPNVFVNKSTDTSGSHNMTTKHESQINYGSLLFNKI